MAFMRLGIAKILGVAVVLSSNTTNYNLKSAVGNPATAINVTLTINSGVTVYATSTGVYALDLSGFASGSVIKLVNNGTIAGAGGAGGGGSSMGYNNAGAGGAGGHAIRLSTTGVTHIIDNASGYILGGGGGGGGGGNGYFETWDGKSMVGNLSAGFAGGIGQGYGYGPGGSVGTNGGGSGAGGTWGNAGGNGYGYAGTGMYGGAGGAAGYAVVMNGNSALTWLAGNNSTQIKGAVA